MIKGSSDKELEVMWPQQAYYTLAGVNESTDSFFNDLNTNSTEGENLLNTKKHLRVASSEDVRQWSKAHCMLRESPFLEIQAINRIMQQIESSKVDAFAKIVNAPTRLKIVK